MAAMAEAGAGQGSGQRGGGSRTMRAAVLHGHGQPPEYGRHPVPRRAAGQALIRVSAAPVNPLDLLLASGTSYFGAPTLPYVPGTQGVGVIEQADTLTPGQRVWFSGSAGLAPGDGTLAELCVVDENGVVPLPETVSDDLVAALGLSAIAAWMALTWRGGMRAGEHVLVLGASGTVGQAGIQVARLHGALTGDDPAVIASRLAEACAGRLDLVLDPVWGVPAQAALRVMSPGGRLVNLGSSAGQEASLSSATLRSGTLSVLGYTNNAVRPEQRAAALTEILGHAAAGRLQVDRERLPLAEIAAGWARCGKAPHRRAVMIPP